MTTTCVDCNTRPAIDGPKCRPCAQHEAWQTSHLDWDHEAVRKGDVGRVMLRDLESTQAEMKKCWVCHPDLDGRNKPTATRTSAGGGTATSHAACDHARTPKAREACRRARRAA